jgi:HAD superfamily hydrolase (TIGR01509 family)
VSARPGILFDLDGTLVDTNYLHTLAWSRALRDCGEWAPMNAIHRLVGMGGDQLVPRLLERDVPELHEARSARYGELLGEIAAFPGAAELLRRLHGGGVTVVLATSSPAAEVDAARRALAADDAIDAVTTADDAARSKPAPDLFSAALEAGGVHASLALVVGDSVWDVEAAERAGLGCVGVETGGFSRHELAERGAVAVYKDVATLGRQLCTGPLGVLLSQARG